MATYPLPTLAAQIDATGITAPTYQDVWLSLQASFQQIYGADAYIEPDSQDGQWLGVIAQAVHDANQTLVATYNSFRPAGAVGEGLSSVVKINGIQRQAASYSTADLTLVGVAGTVVNNGVATDGNGNQWALPATVTIGLSGSVTATATCRTLGAITAPANTITGIFTPTRGWQTVTNAAAATVGAPIETDAALRRRQAGSVSLPATRMFAAILAGVGNVSGVSHVSGIENDTGSTDGNGIPAHSISVVVEGGDDTAIATEIATRKLGTGTYGTTTVIVEDQNGVPATIHFYRPTLADIAVEIDIAALAGYTSAQGDAAIQSVADYINGLGVGDDVYFSRLYTPANSGGADYVVDAIRIGRDGGSPSAANITLNFHELATCNPANITISVL